MAGLGAGVWALVLLASAAPAGAATMDVSGATTTDGHGGQVGLMLEQGKLTFGSSVVIDGDPGRTHLTSSAFGWASFGRQEAWTGFGHRLQDNSGTYELRSNTQLKYAVGGRFIDHIKGQLERSHDGTGNASLKFGFNNLDTNLALFGGAPLGVQTGLSFEQTNGQLRTLSTISSSFGVGNDVDVHSSIRWTDDGVGSIASTLDTRLVYQAALPFVERIVGHFHRNALGNSQRTLSMYFPGFDRQRLGQTRFSLDTKATFEEVAPAIGASVWRMGLETTLSGIAPSLLGGTYSLSLRLEQGLGIEGAYRSSLSYDHSWHPGRFCSVGLDLKLVDTVAELEPTVGIQWLATF